MPLVAEQLTNAVRGDAVLADDCHLEARRLRIRRRDQLATDRGVPRRSRRQGEGYRKAFKDCSLASADLAGPVSHTGPDLLKYAWDCVPSLMQADIVATG